MADEDELELKDEEKIPAACGGAPEMPEEPPSKARRGILGRLLPIGALLIALTAAGLYFTLGEPEVPEEKRESAEPARQPIPIAPRPVPAGEKPAPAPRAEGKKALAKQEKAGPAEAKVKAEGAKYTLGGGAFLLESNRRQAEEKARRLGFSFRVEPVTKKVGMTRLRIGTFAPEEAGGALEEVQMTAPDAFLLREGDKIALYAASYFDLDKARGYADELYRKGISVVEESAQVEVSLALLTYGAFPDRASALEAARKAEEVGLEAQLLPFN